MDFIESGSQIISTNSYATQPNYYMSAFEKEDYMRLMCEHAKVRKICYQPNFLFMYKQPYTFLIIRIVLRIHEFSYNNQSSIICSGFKISWICENTWSAHQMIPEISNSESMIFFANFFNWGQNWPKSASMNSCLF